MGAHVQAIGVERSFVKGGSRIDVLRGASVEVAPGEAVALLGESGSGKSTFLSIVGALEPPTGGVVRVDGVAIHAQPRSWIDRYRNQQVGFIFQFHHLLPDHSALDNAAMPGFIGRLSPAEARARARVLLGEVGLGHRLEHKPGELSGGEQQRVAIARALLMSPSLLLADEPTGNLDPSNAGDVFALLVGLARERGMTMLVVTHSNELASRFSRRLRLQDGRFVEAA